MQNSSKTIRIIVGIIFIIVAIISFTRADNLWGGISLVLGALFIYMAFKDNRPANASRR